MFITLQAFTLYINLFMCAVLLLLIYCIVCGDTCCSHALKLDLTRLDGHHLDRVVSNYCWSNNITTDATTS